MGEGSSTVGSYTPLHEDHHEEKYCSH